MTYPRAEEVLYHALTYCRDRASLLWSQHKTTTRSEELAYSSAIEIMETLLELIQNLRVDEYAGKAVLKKQARRNT